MSANEQRESNAGVHFLQTYQTCPRSWYFKYVLGFLPESTPMPLVFGAAFHEYKAARYRGTPEKEAEAIAVAILRNRLDELPPYTDVATLEDDLARMVGTTEVLIRKDLETFEIIAVEEQIEPRLENGFTMTMRPDALARDRKSGDIYILEHKTTRSSIGGMIRSITNGLQARAYVWGVRKVLAIPSNVTVALLPEVTYLKGRVCEAVYGDPITPTQYDLDAFEASMIGLFSELGEKIERLKGGLPAEVLFPPATHLCTGFLQCEYEPICRTFWDGTTVPSGFRKDEAITGPVVPGPNELLVAMRRAK